MLKFLWEKYSIGLKRLAKISTESNIIFLDLIILQKFLSSFMLVILISRNLDEQKKG